MYFINKYNKTLQDFLIIQIFKILFVFLKEIIKILMDKIYLINLNNYLYKF